jgi:hypothetical protein
MRKKIRNILTNLESVKEDLLALSDDIWLSIDHNASQAVQRGAEFKIAYNDCMQAFTADADRLSLLVEGFTEVSIDSVIEGEQPEGRHVTRQDRDRVILDLDRHTPHSLIEDFRYKRPFGFTLEGEPYVPRATWSLVYISVCKHVARKSPILFQSLPDNPDFLSSRGNRFFSKKADDLRSGREVDMGIFAEFNLSANQIRDAIKKLLSFSNIPHEQFVGYLREDRDARE